MKSSQLNDYTLGGILKHPDSIRVFLGVMTRPAGRLKRLLTSREGSRVGSEAFRNITDRVVWYGIVWCGVVWCGVGLG